MGRKLIVALAALLVIAAAAPAGAEPKGFVEDQFEYGFFYGTFDERPNIALFAGGTLEEFCDGDPGIAKLRVFFKKDGTVDLKVNDKAQEIHLYETDYDDIPAWLGDVCPDILEGKADAPEPFAMGHADLKVRFSFLSESTIEIFNSVNGKAKGTDGTEYKVRGTADLVVVDGVPQGDPRDFVGFKLTEIRR